jgi:hypothetical protein
LRIDQAGGWSDLTGWDNERRAGFQADRDWEHFCELLGESGDGESVSMAIRRQDGRLRRSPSWPTLPRKV